MIEKNITVAFFSNFINHHQAPFCLEMAKLLGKNFTFIATEEMNSDLKAFWNIDEQNSKYSFVLRAYENDDNKEKALKLARECDVVIVGSAPELYIRERIKTNRLTFRYMERPLKEGRWQLLKPRKLYAMLRTHTYYIGRNLYLLCASAYTAGDCALVGGYWGKAYKWGYFPEVRPHDLDSLFFRKRRNKTIDILWAGRLIEWKHPDYSILLADRLKREGYSFCLNIIGDGEQKVYLSKLIEERQLQDCVNLLGSMTPESVRDYMENSDIFLFTSDKREGWGAVLNESMNSACAVIADKNIGSVPFLIHDGIDGLIYDGTFDDLYCKLKCCMNSYELINSLGRNAYFTIYENWNPAVAANRIIALSEALINGSKFRVKEGPCSYAKWI